MTLGAGISNQGKLFYLHHQNHTTHKTLMNGEKKENSKSLKKTFPRIFSIFSLETSASRRRCTPSRSCRASREGGGGGAGGAFTGGAGREMGGALTLERCPWLRSRKEAGGALKLTWGRGPPRHQEADDGWVLLGKPPTSDFNDGCWGMVS